MKKTLIIIVALAGLSSFICRTGRFEEKVFLSPTHVLVDSLTGRTYISLSTANRIAVVNARTNQFERYINLPFNPGESVLKKEQDVLIVTDQCQDGSVHFISLQSGKIIRKVQV